MNGTTLTLLGIFAASTVKRSLDEVKSVFPDLPPATYKQIASLVKHGHLKKYVDGAYKITAKGLRKHQDEGHPTALYNPPLGIDEGVVTLIDSSVIDLGSAVEHHINEIVEKYIAVADELDKCRAIIANLKSGIAQLETA